MKKPPPRRIDEINKCVRTFLDLLPEQRRKLWPGVGPEEIAAPAELIGRLMCAAPSLWRDAEIRRNWNKIEALIR